VRLLTMPQVAELLQLSRAQIYRLAEHGCLPVVRLGPRSLRVREEGLERWLEGLEETATKEGADEGA
jgi:excisionase family DNA binding protein